MLRKSASFPVGLYAILLLALAWLTLPALFGPVERWLVGSATAVPRLASMWFGRPARAAGRDDLGRVEELRAELNRRVTRQNFSAGAGVIPVAAEKLLCGVLSASRVGGGGRMSELLLDHSYAELEGCDLVVKGDQLIGFLMRPGQGRAIDDLPADPARVMLCNHRDAPRLYASVDEDGGGGVGGLRVVVRAGSSADPAPMRVDLWNDPYQAAQMDESGLLVRTRALKYGATAQRVPGGLLLGRAKVWGYDDQKTDDVLTIAVYVEPLFEPHALSHVVLWRAPAVRGGRSSMMRAHRRVSGVVYDLPGADRGRHLLVTDTGVPDGAAVTQEGMLVGVARGLCLGSGLATSFGASRRRWSLLFLPDGDTLPAFEMSGVVERAAGNVAWVRWEGPPRDQLPRSAEGHLFTGSNGRFCPSGLWIGRARVDRLDRDLLEVRSPVTRGARAVDVLVDPSEAR
ncbi:MAG: hypothetical protein CMJ88_14420 [Planctomycetes bacterium]|nr:hypothetical protein [Planctomycetota bacterium]